jgi:leucyl-tRNA synthetase
VKRRIFNDSLELRCLPNTVKQKLQNAKSDFFELSNDLQRPEGNKKASNIIKSVLPEYCETLTFYIPHLFNTAKQRYVTSGTPFLSSLLALVQEQPPESMRFLS